MFLKKKKIKSYKDLDAKATLIENFSNLVFVNKILNKIEYFVFFGTLLGLVREKNLIKNDDDIDIYINIKDRNKVIEILKKNSVIVDLKLSVNKEKCFLQVKRTINNKNAIIDFYFYDCTARVISIYIIDMGFYLACLIALMTLMSRSFSNSKSLQCRIKRYWRKNRI